MRYRIFVLGASNGSAQGVACGGTEFRSGARCRSWRRAWLVGVSKGGCVTTMCTAADGCSVERSGGRAVRRAGGRTVGRLVGRSDGRAVGWSGGRVVRRSDGRTSGRSGGRFGRRGVGRSVGRAVGRSSGPRPIARPIVHRHSYEEQNYYTVVFAVSRALGVMAQYVWSRALGLPIERPKSVPLDTLKAALKK